MAQQPQSSGDATQANPRHFGDYEVEASIGRGKFAVVYRAHKIGDTNAVALKRISVDMMNDTAREKCLKEVRVLQNLDHPNIIGYMDSFICNNDLIIVYEWAAAGDLKHQIRLAIDRGTPFEERVIWKYFSQICSAIQHMHEKRIMHRDLKPANIFLTLKGAIKVGDLGLSRELSDNTFQAHSKVGTPLYMAPEVLRGDGYDFKTDIWSLGCLLYELATLKSPFRSEGLNLTSLFQKISNGDYAPLPETLSSELRSLCAKMMATRPEDRPEIGYVVDIATQMRKKTASEKRQRAQSTDEPASKASVSAQETSSKIEAEPEEGKEQFSEKARERRNSQRNNVSNADKKEGVDQQAIAAEDDAERIQRRPSVSAEKKPSRGESAERKKPNPFQRGNSQQSLHGEDGAVVIETRPRRVESEDDDEKTVVARGGGGGEGISLNDYFNHREQRREEPWNSVTRPNNNDNAQDRTNSSSPVPSTDIPPREDEHPPRGSRPALRRDDSFHSHAGSASNTSSRPSSSRPVSGVHSKFAAVEPEPAQQQPAKLAVYHRSKPPKAPSSSSANTHAAHNGASAPGTAEMINSRPSSSRPASNYSRPSTVDDSPGFAPPTSDRNNPKLMEALDNASPAFALMDNVYGKLSVLGYPMEEPGVTKDRTGRGRLLPIHFAVNVNAFPTVAGSSQGYQFMPFKRMVHVILWLCEHKLTSSNVGLQRIVKNIDVESATNMTIAKQLLQAAQAAGEVSEELAAATPTSLTPGFGYNVCLLLNHFADCALRASNFTAHTTVHARELEIENADSTDDSMDDDKSVILEEDEEPTPEDANEMTSSQTSVSMSRNRFHLPDYANRRIDPLLWKQETERVSALLKKEITASTAASEASWQHHVEMIVKYCSTHLQHLKKHHEELKKKSEEAKRIDPMERPLGKQAKAAVQPELTAKSPVAEAISLLKQQLQADMQKLTQNEKYVNLQPRFDAISREFSNFKKENVMYEEISATSSSAIADLSEKLGDLETQLEETHSLLNSRLAGDDDNGTNRVIRIKEAILNMQKEIREMHMSTGIASEELIQRQKDQLYRQDRMRKKKAQARRRGRNAVVDTELDDYV